MDFLSSLFSKPRVCITGATSFLGQHIATMLKKQGKYTIRLMTTSNENFELYQDIFPTDQYEWYTISSSSLTRCDNVFKDC